MRTWLAVAIICVITCACGSSEVLLSKPAKTPAGLDLSGEWVMTGSTGFSQREARDLAVYIFLETGEALKVTQTNSGLFFSFDRSVVEEYRFGENREVEVGAIKAARVSGWEAGAYVVETLDEHGAKLVESWRLQHNGDVLQRKMVIWNRGDRKLALEQRYERI